MTDPQRDRADPEVRVFLRPLGTPVPLGFLGLAVATVLVSSLQLGWIPAAEQHQVGLAAVAFAIPLQGVASVLCFLGRDAPAGAGIGVQAATWLALGLLLLTGTPGARSDTTSVLLFAAAAALLPPAATAALGKIVPALVLAATAARFALTGVYEAVGGLGWERAAGWEGIALAGLALYASLALDLEAALRRPFLPLGRWHSGREALEPGLREDPATLAREPGVRQQL